MKFIAKTVGIGGPKDPDTMGAYGDLYKKIYAVVRRIPQGRVATYGQVARLAGIPRHARQVGYALSALPDDLDIAWHRVVNAKGEISLRSVPHFADMQRERLHAEGIVFNPRGQISLRHFQWKKTGRHVFTLIPKQRVPLSISEPL